MHWMDKQSKHIPVSESQTKKKKKKKRFKSSGYLVVWEVDYPIFADLFTMKIVLFPLNHLDAWHFKLLLAYN